MLVKLESELALETSFHDICCSQFAIPRSFGTPHQTGTSACSPSAVVSSKH